MLYRIELGWREGEVTAIAASPFVEHTVGFLPNGMAVDPRGDLFVSNTYSTYTGEAAILKLEVDPEPFSFEEVDWLPADLGGGMPNGVQLARNTLYLASQSSVLQVEIQRDGTAASVRTLYSGNADNLLDDFAVVADKLVVCEIDNPFAPPESSTSQLTVIGRMGTTAGEVVGVIP